jgi:glycosyltransferase involved in cell wall biosynthesis
MNLADVLIAVSEAGRTGLQIVGRASRPIHVIPYGVDPLPAAARRERPDGEFVVTCVGRLSPQKGQADLIEAMARLLPAAPGASLLLAGTGPDEAGLRAKACQLGLEHRVEFLGLVTRPELPGLFARTDVVALPSYWEGLPVALIEALAAGKPIVASDAGGSSELVRHGENGLIVPAGDIEALSASLLQLARDPALRDRMGTAASARFRSGEFAPGRVARQHEQVYRLAIDQRRERRRAPDRSAVARQ